MSRGVGKGKSIGGRQTRLLQTVLATLWNGHEQSRPLHHL